MSAFSSFNTLFHPSSISFHLFLVAVNSNSPFMQYGLFTPSLWHHADITLTSSPCISDGGRNLCDHRVAGTDVDFEKLSVLYLYFYWTKKKKIKIKVSVNMFKLRHKFNKDVMKSETETETMICAGIKKKDFCVEVCLTTWFSGLLL